MAGTGYLFQEMPGLTILASDTWLQLWIVLEFTLLWFKMVPCDPTDLSSPARQLFQQHHTYIIPKRLFCVVSCPSDVVSAQASTHNPQ